MASFVALKQLRVPVSRLAISFRPDVFDRFSFTARRMYHESFSLTTAETVPHMFMREDGESVYAFLDLPGIPKENVKVTVDCTRELVIKANVDAAYMSECRKYNHTINLPEKIKTIGIKADMKDGMLKVTLPKLKENKEEKVTHVALIPVN